MQGYFFQGGGIIFDDWGKNEKWDIKTQFN